MTRSTILASGALALLVATGMSVSHGCSETEPVRPSPIEVDPPKPVEIPQPVEIPPMTEEEIAAVVASAKAAEAAIEKGNKQEKAVKKKKGSFRAVLDVWTKLDPQPGEAFDYDGATRLLDERPAHPDAPYVREVKNRLAGARLHHRLLELFEPSELSKNKDSPTWYTDQDRIGREFRAKVVELSKDVEELLSEVQAEANRTRLSAQRDVLTNLIEFIDDSLQELAPNVERERFVAEGGIEVTAKQLFTDFDANEVAALQKYGGRSVRVTGTVSRIEADFQDKPAVHLATGAMLRSVTVTGVPVDVAAGLKKGQKFAATCKRVSEALGSPICESAPAEE